MSKNDKSRAGKEARTVRGAKRGNVPAPTPKPTPKTETKVTLKKGDPKTGQPKPKGSANKKASTPVAKKPQPRRDIAGQALSPSEAVMAYGEVFSMEDAIQVAELDRKLGKVSTSSDYAQANSWQYYLGINSWYLVVADLHRTFDPYARAARALVSYIRHYGLVATIGLCCDAAQRLVREEEPSDQIQFLLTGDLQIDLQSLRYLKRFTVLEADIMKRDNIKTWLKVERGTRAFNCRQWSGYNKYQFLIERIREYVSEWLKDYIPIGVDLDLPSIPTGSTFELDEKKKPLTLLERAKRYVRVAHDGRRFLFASADPKWETPVERTRTLWDVAIERVDVPSGDKRGTLFKRCPTGGKRNLVKKTYRVIYPVARRCFYSMHVRSWTAPVKRFNRLTAVPKTYKAYRTVCPESPLNQMMQQKNRDHVWNALPVWVKQHFPMRDQSVMERLAAAGRALNLSTTDASHASDSFSVRVFVDAFPADVVRDVLRWRPTHTLVEGYDEDHVLQQLSTMGTGNVWLLMGIFLLACECVACDLGGVSPGRRNGCFVFGDDMIHPSEVADILYWILETMNFVINRDKSFSGDAKYRESCGSEWWQENESSDVISLRTLYYPRFPVCNGKKLSKPTWDYDVATGEQHQVDGLSRLIALQHSLYYVAPSAAEFLARAVMRLEPSMTTSRAGSVCDDLWGEFAVGPIKVDASLGEPPKNGVRADGTRFTGVWKDPELGYEVPLNTRVGHMVLTTVGASPADPVLREWLYVDFLNHGPAQADLPGCFFFASEARMLVDPQTTTIKWKVVF